MGLAVFVVVTTANVISVVVLTDYGPRVTRPRELLAWSPVTR